MRRYAFIMAMFFHYLMGMFLLPITLLIGKFDKKLQKKIGYWFNRQTGLYTMWISGAKYVVKGLENIDKHQNVLFVGNHKSMLDILVLMKYIKRPIVFIGKKSVLKWPVISWWMRVQDTLFLDRDSIRDGLKVIMDGIERLKNGDSVVIFPEGTRSKTDELLPFKKGSFKLATKSGVPIVPFAIKGTDEVLENNHFNLAPKTVYFTVGEPIFLNEMEDTLKDNYTSYVRDVIVKLYDEM